MIRSSNFLVCVLRQAMLLVDLMNSHLIFILIKSSILWELKIKGYYCGIN